MSRLVIMTKPPQDGFEGLVNTYWVLQNDNKTVRHTTAVQTEMKLKLPPSMSWGDYFTVVEGVPQPPEVEEGEYVVALTKDELSATIEAFNVAEWSPEGRPPLKHGHIMLSGGPHGQHSAMTAVGGRARSKFARREGLGPNAT